MKVVLIHGNGGQSVEKLWFPYIQSELTKQGIEVIARTFPDNELAREEYWIPFLKDELKADKETILVGHSSGAVAALRFAETTPILGSVLIGVYYTDLGIESEKQAGYFNRPWNWDAIRQNQQWTVIFASTDDPWIPIEQPRFIQQQLGCDYREFNDQGHFGGDYDKTTFPELAETIMEKLG